MNLDEESSSFFGAAADISLIVTALLSSLISLSIPLLYYLKRQCQQHPTVLLANISLLQAVANFNIILMAYNYYGFEKLLHIRQVFAKITFGLTFTPTQDQFCVTNYYIYMLLELLSISFHICYSVDLFITLKKKTKKNLLSLFNPVSSFDPPKLRARTLKQLLQNLAICNNLEEESVFEIPIMFLLSVMVFTGISLGIIVMSFFTNTSQSKIRTSYIRQHRTTLFVLVLMWACPIWSNINIHFLNQPPQQTRESPLNFVAFLSIVSSSGVIAIIRILFDGYLRKRVFFLVFCNKPKSKAAGSTASEEYIEVSSDQKEENEDAWNVPLSGAMNEFQSQQILHTIIQVVAEACSNVRKPHRTSVFHEQVQIQNTQFESIHHNTIHIEREAETFAESFLNRLWQDRKEERLLRMDPSQCDLQQLKQLCKLKKKFDMVCVCHSRFCNEQQRLKHKNVRIKGSQLSEQLDETSSLDIKVTAYSHLVFDSLRVYYGFSEQQIQKSLDLQNNIEQIKRAKESLGASGSFFFFSFDYKLVIKTISEEEKDKMVSILPQYYNHLKYNSESLLAKVFGIFSLQISQVSKIYFLMMENTVKFFEQNKLEYTLYDLKGSTIQREVKSPQGASVLKDINYFRSADCFMFMTSENKVRLMDIIEKDINMLKQFNIMDYSLLLGVAKTRPKRKSRLSILDPSDLRLIDNYHYIQELEPFTNKIYCLSIIDFLQQFNFQKRAELWLKRIFRGGGDISSVDTEIYYRRFLKFMKRIIVTFNAASPSQTRARSNLSRVYSGKAFD